MLSDVMLYVNTYALSIYNQTIPNMKLAYKCLLTYLLHGAESFLSN